MEREVVINKVLRDLKQFELIKEDDSSYIRKHLEFLYGAAWDEGRKSLGGHKKKKVELYNTRKNIKIPFDSIVIASHIIKDSVSTIKRSLRSGIATEKGHIWSYKKDII